MPNYIFQCKKCKIIYEELTPWDEKRKWPNIKCPRCKSKKKEQQLHDISNAIFTNPRGTSKWDNFGYRAGKTAEEAKECRRNAEEASHMGGSADIYKHIDDISSGLNEDFGKI